MLLLLSFILIRRHCNKHKEYHNVFLKEGDEDYMVIYKLKEKLKIKNIEDGGARHFTSIVCKWICCEEHWDLILEIGHDR